MSGLLVAAGITPLMRWRASPALTGFIFQWAASRALGLTRAGTVSLYASFSIATPGSCLPSRYSNVAPPPVETHEKRPVSPSASMAAAVSPPPAREKGPDLVSTSPTATVPSPQFRHSTLPLTQLHPNSPAP